MPWEVGMAYDAVGRNDIGPHLRISEVSSWSALVMSVFAGLKGVAILLGTITPDAINSWFLLIGSLVLSGIATGTLVYSRVIRARLEGSTLTEIFQANNNAIRIGKPIPFPAFLPKGAITVTTTIDVTTTPKPQAEKDG